MACTAGRFFYRESEPPGKPTKEVHKDNSKIMVTKLNIHFHSNTWPQTDSITQSKSWFAVGEKKKQAYSAMSCIVVPYRHMLRHYQMKCTPSLTRPFAQLIVSVSLLR